MKTRWTEFAAGIAVGAVAMWAIDEFRSAERAEPASVAAATGIPLQQPAADTSDRGKPDHGRADRVPANVPTSGAGQRGAAPDQPNEAPTERAFESPGPTVSASRTNARVEVPISDAHREMLADPSMTEGAGGGTAGPHAELEAEPEDDSWSYFMEQSLRQFLGQHPNASLFTIFNVECRTTLCEIQATGFDPSTAPDWDRILYDLAQQAWYDFGMVTTARDEYQGQLAIVTHLTRLQSG